MRLTSVMNGVLWAALVVVFGTGCTEAENDGDVVVVASGEPDAALPTVDAQPQAVADAAPDMGPPPTSVARRVLHECFTGSNCSPCFESAEFLEEVFEANAGKFTAIKYQIGSDPYISREAVDRRMMYLPGEMTYPIPYVHADGVNGFHPNEINNDEGYQQMNFDAFQSVPSPLEMTVSHTLEGQTISVDVEMEAFDTVAGEQLRLFVAVIENVTYENVGSNGQTEFHRVFKKFIPNADGIPLEALAPGEQRAVQRDYTFEGGYTGETGIRNMVRHNREHTVEEFDDLSVVAFVQDVETWQVFQSAWDAPAHPTPKGEVEGQVLMLDGTPVADAPMTSCDDVECLTGMTDADGRYRFSGLPPMTRKMEVIAPDGALDLIYAQEVGPEHVPLAVNLAPAVGEAVAWRGQEGGTVTLSGGQLELTAAPGTLEYGLGVDEAVRAGVVALSELPPYHEVANGAPPWHAEGAAGIGFMLNPVHIQAEEPVSFVVRATNAGRVSPLGGDDFDVYAVDVDTALYMPVGSAHRNEALEIVGHADATLLDVSVLILVRRGDGPE